MDKIKELLAQIGASEEAAAQICEAFEAWKTSQKTTLDGEFKARLIKAKEVCLEETDIYKKNIARKVEIFLESQIAAVERSAQERMAIEESKAVNILKRTKSMLEGIEIDVTNEDLQAVQGENEGLRNTVIKVGQERDDLKAKYERTKQIAEKTLARNKTLEEKMTNQVTEPVTESKKGTKLDNKRGSSSKPKTTRRTLTESQQIGKQPTNEPVEADTDISSIAATVDTLP